MTMYKFLQNGIKRISDGATIPIDEKNTDYKEYLSWVAAGNEAAPPDIENHQESVLAKISSLEFASLLNRGSRELQMRIIEQQAGGNSAALASQPYYIKLKALDDEIKALRAQL